MAYTDKKWISSIGMHIDRFKWTTLDVATGRCPICGDSKTSPTKTRLYFYPVEKKYFIKCFNCGASMSLGNFIKNVFPSMHSEYLTDSLIERGAGEVMQKADWENKEVRVKSRHVVVEGAARFKDSVPVAAISEKHPAYRYLLSRRIPESAFARIHFTNSFKDWVELNRPEGAERHRNLPDDQRILFPIINFDGTLIGVQGRSLEPNAKIRYLTIKYDPTYSRLYGRDILNTLNLINVVEGPIDSLFLPNCLALCGGDVSRDLGTFDQKLVRIILDNEPRSHDTIKRYTKAIDAGFTVVIWNEIPSNLKDINDMVLAGYTQEQLCAIIERNSYKGVEAKLQLFKWKRV